MGTTLTDGMIVRHVKVDRTRTAQEMLDATGRRQYLDVNAMEMMPQNKGDEEAEIFFFKPDHYGNDDDLKNEYESRGLKPANPFELAAVNEADPAFADNHPNGTHWREDALIGDWHYIAFEQWGKECVVEVRCHIFEGDDDDRYEYLLFAGVRK